MSSPNHPTADATASQNPTTGGCPVHYGGNNQGPVLPGEGDTDYERYMRTDDLLSLQKTDDEWVNPDEPMFQTIHQAFELWMKLVLWELERIKGLLDEDQLLETLPRFERCNRILRLNADALRVLDTMHPWDFHVIRANLGNGSGAESPGFNRILRHAPTLWKHIEALLERRDTTLLDAYTNPDKDLLLLRVLDGLTDVDQSFHAWRNEHLGLVKRQIGRDVKSLKGFAVHQLEHDVMSQMLWPELWKVRNAITELSGTSPA